MPPPLPDHPDHPDPDRVREDLVELTDLVSIGFEVDGPVAQVGESTWAIYGHSSYDGEIIVGEYPDAEEASEVLRAAPHLAPDPAPGAGIDLGTDVDPGLAPP